MSFADIVWTRASQTRAVLSNDAVTMRDPSGLKAADEIAPELTGHGLPLSKCEAYNRGC
jgi:hypothetical protein